jgi:predicted TIM-barrel fold metal-dependent hydrolase
MIVDCHAHVFRNWHDACGHPTVGTHLKYLQKIVTRPSARVLRIRDGAPASTSVLFRADDNTWEGLAAVDFRVGRYGQLHFTHAGEDYAVQYMPVGMQTIESPPDYMIAQMTAAGVDHCILQAGGGYGAMNDYNAFAQSQYPDRFTGLSWIDEATADQPETLDELRRAHGVLGLKGLYYAQDFSRHGYRRNLDHPDFALFWELVRELEAPVFVELSATPNYDRASYLTNLAALDRLLARMPDTRFVLVMGLPVAHFAPHGSWDIPFEALTIYRRPNLLIEVMFPITWGGEWDYPYPEAQALIRGMRDLFGADKLVWGSDMPNVERFCTYKQSLDYVRRYCGFLSSSEKDRILGVNAAELMKLRGSSRQEGQAA